MNKNQAYDYFFNHIKKWEKFLSKSIRTLNTNDELIGEQIKKERQFGILKDILVGAVANPFLLDAFIYPEGQIGKINNSNIEKYVLRNLDASQREAVNKAVKTDNICFIQGPPGTGKTTVISEICLQLIKSNPKIRILICSETHIAVDNIIDKFSKIESDELAKNLKYLRVFEKESNSSAKQQKASVEKYRDNYFNRLYESNIGDDIVNDFVKIIGNDDLSFAKELMFNMDFIGVTCNSLAKISFRADETFDYVIFDEVCKATLPEILIPLSISKRAILVGDPKQLPPVFLQEDEQIMNEIDACDLSKVMYIDSLFDRLPSAKKHFLSNQYRMTNEIGNIISKHFYDSKLKNGMNRSDKNSIIWCDYLPSKEWGLISDESPFNLDEVKIVNMLLKIENSRKVNRDIAIITPYKGQKAKIMANISQEEFKNLNIVIDTVDSFQGKDSDIVIFSVTRSAGSLRFFSNPRRLNVALSRAKNMCYIVGFSSYAKRNDVLKAIYESIPNRFMKN